MLVSLGIDGARCWNAENGAQVGRPPFDPIPIVHAMAATWLPGGKLMLASATDEGLARAEVFAGSHQQEAFEPAEGDDEDEFGDPALYDVVPGRWPDGRPFFAAAGVSGAVRLVDAATGDPMRPALRGLGSQAIAVAVTTLADGTVVVAAGGEDRVVLRWNAVWDAGTGVAWPDLRETWSATTVTLADGRTMFAIGRTDGSITLTTLPAG